MGLEEWWKALTYRISRSKRGFLATILFVLAFAGGVVMAFVSATPEVELVGTQVVEGSAPVGNHSTRVDFPPVGLTEAVLEVGPCGLNLHFLRDPEWEVFNESGTLPPPQLTCDIRAARLPEGAGYLLLVNERGIPSDYRVAVTFYRVGSPFALLVLPGLVLVLVGSVGIIAQILRRGLTKTVDKILEK